MKKILPLILVSLCLQGMLAFSQNKTTTESAEKFLESQSEANILYQQQFLDSLVKASIKNELRQSEGESLKTKELESKLKKMETIDSLRKVELTQKIESLKKNAKGCAVAPFKDTLFMVYIKLVSSTPEERALNISNRIKKLYSDPFYRPDSLKLVESEIGTEIVYSPDETIMLVNNVDAMFYNKDSKQLASQYLGIIKNSISQERETNSLSNYLLNIGLALLVIAGLSLLIYLINRSFRWIRSFMTVERTWLKNGLLINRIRIFTPEKLVMFILRISNLIRILVIMITVYMSLPLLFSLFPETKMWTTTLLEWVLSPARNAVKGVIGFLPNLFTILIIFYIFRYAIKGMKYFVDQIEKEEILINGFHADWAQPTFRLLKFLLYAFMLILVFPYLPGSGSPAFQGVSVFVGILFSLGSSSAIANMVAGMVITYMRPFRIGDRVKIGEITGDVMEKTMLVTRLRTIKNEDITVPNSTVLLSSTTNFSTNARIEANGLILNTTVTIGYDIPWKDMHQTLIKAALLTDMILKDPLPFVLQTSLDDFYVSYQINAYTREANQQAMIYSLLHQNIQDCCNEAGIEILSPHYHSMRDGNMTSIPANYLGKDYKAPSFTVRQESNK
ncbi:MAG: mechanosensitive ion channel family protein [Bacteroidota bacterium]